MRLDRFNAVPLKYLLVRTLAGLRYAGRDVSECSAAESLVMQRTTNAAKRHIRVNSGKIRSSAADPASTRWMGSRQPSVPVHCKEVLMTGVIYILTNPSFPQYVKIGYADDLQK